MNCRNRERKNRNLRLKKKLQYEKFSVRTQQKNGDKKGENELT